MNYFATVLAVLIAACTVIMLQALDVAHPYVFIGGLVVVTIASWLVDDAK